MNKYKCVLEKLGRNENDMCYYYMRSKLGLVRDIETKIEIDEYYKYSSSDTYYVFNNLFSKYLFSK